MATPVVTYTFSPATLIESAKVNQNFNDLLDFLQNDTVHVDASNAFTAIPSGPSSNPSSDDQLARKKYVDDSHLTGRTTLSAHNVAPPAIGTGSFRFQAGSSVVTLNGVGIQNISFPTAFPTNVLTVVACSGDSIGVGIDCEGYAASYFTVLGNRYSDGSAAAGVAVRVNWIAVGW